MRAFLGVMSGVLAITTVILSVMAMGLLMVSCTHRVVQAAEARNPGCAVVALEERGDWARVRVTCPGQAPVERTYGR